MGSQQRFVVCQAQTADGRTVRPGDRVRPVTHRGGEQVFTVRGITCDGIDDQGREVYGLWVETQQNACMRLRADQCLCEPRLTVTLFCVYPASAGSDRVQVARSHPEDWSAADTLLSIWRRSRWFSESVWAVIEMFHEGERPKTVYTECLVGPDFCEVLGTETDIQKSSFLPALQGLCDMHDCSLEGGSGPLAGYSIDVVRPRPENDDGDASPTVLGSFEMVDGEARWLDDPPALTFEGKPFVVAKLADLEPGGESR